MHSPYISFIIMSISLTICLFVCLVVCFFDIFYLVFVKDSLDVTSSQIISVSSCSSYDDVSTNSATSALGTYLRISLILFNPGRSEFKNVKPYIYPWWSGGINRFGTFLKHFWVSEESRQGFYRIRRHINLTDGREIGLSLIIEKLYSIKAM